MISPAKFHQTDPSGLQTLERFAAATHFNRWLFNTIQPFCKGHVLEVGSGIGNLSQFFLEQRLQLTASDLRDEYCMHLQQLYGHNPYLQAIKSIDLIAPYFETRYASLLEQFDTVVALNVVEHIQHDQLAIKNCTRLLKPGGQLIILVPAYPWLYNPFDVELGHFRRYTARSLTNLLKNEQLALQHRQYFNAAGIAGWFINGGLLRKKLIPRRQLQLFDRLIPIIKFADTITFKAIGLSVVAIGQKTT